MRQQDALELGLDLRAIVRVWEFLSDRRDQVLRLMPACPFRDFQHVLKVALDGCFHALVALDMFQVPNTEAHQRRRREHNGQLQRQGCLRAFALDILSLASLLTYPYYAKTIKTPTSGCVKASQMIVNSCKETPLAVQHVAQQNMTKQR
jgi:hypothetical protein